MMKQNTVTTLEGYPLPDSLSTERQVIADIIAQPETLMEAEKILTGDTFSDPACRAAFETLREMAKEGKIIDLTSAYGRIDRELMLKGVMPMMANTGGAMLAHQHYALLKEYSIKRKCYFKAMELLAKASEVTATSQDLIGMTGVFAESLRKELEVGKGIQHISTVFNELGEQVEEKARLKAEGKALRTPTGFYTLDYLTYGGFNAGNLVILAARPSVGKTAVMLQMARAAASAGKAVNLYNLEMMNTELAQRFLFATEQVTPLQMAKANVDWKSFEIASGQFASKPIYLSDSLFTEDEIIADITLNVQSGKCDIVFIDYLGLVTFADTKSTPAYAIAAFTKRLKSLAKSCKIPIVLLCQLNRSSASEKRSPQLYDLRDSGAVEQDADTVLMLERATESLDGKEVYMWVRKNRGGSAGEVRVEMVANETFTRFADRNEPLPPSDYETGYGSSDFENSSNFF